MKSINITVIAPYEGLMKTVKRVIRQSAQMKYDVYLADLQEAIPIIHKVDASTDLYISRGGTANVIREHTTKQVVEIPISGYDILRTLLLIQDEKDGAEIIAFENISMDFNEISQLLDIRVPITSIHSEKEAEPAVIKAKEAERRVIIGDTVTNQLANRYGVEGILITSGEESVKHAFEQAETIRQVHDYHSGENHLYKVLAQQIDEAFLIVKDSAVVFKSDTLKQLEAKHDIDGMLQAFINSANGEYLQASRHILYSNGNPFQIQVQPMKNNDLSENTIVYIRSVESMVPGFASWLVTDSLTLPLVLGTDQRLNQHFNHVLEQEGPILVIGEEGSGERCIARTIMSNDWTIECDVSKDFDMDKLFETKMPLFLVHVDRMSSVKQKKLMLKAEQYCNQVVFFCESRAITKYCQGRVIELPTLQERFSQDTSFIPGFIAKANSRFGKQVIGLTEDAVQLEKVVCHYSLVEFRNLIFKEIERSDSSYISIGPEQQEFEQDGYLLLDLSKTLDEMESEIIQKVLEEEGFNQSKTAKRLNVNRTTIWRKLK
ncbi:PrpR N-terminal domain-containing protein [Alkalicoccobacillus porphyridii]|uniref:Sigma-54-dependent transcriptional regulator n=1 Tax=Alkalicoccobacillus porphyridii TaxID=2597270 RepID=A0A554A460_9BACI|nr:PrpR N-terminal domain-containing protein [Alkalicoccobacillus porphyridii]TSB48467.1 hypothetical protein FN960_02625 [Alkalicoccobacillus porphyridii]